MSHHKKNHVISNSRTKRSAERKWRRQEKEFLKTQMTEDSGRPKTRSEKTPRVKTKSVKGRQNKKVVSIYTVLHESES